MKCVCGFTSASREGFQSHIVQLKIEDQWFDANEQTELRIYICPSCGTLKVNKP